MKLLIGNQLPFALSRFFEAHGSARARHVLDVAPDEAAGREMWRFAEQGGYVIVSKDERSFHMANLAPSAPQMVRVRLGDCRKGPLVDAFAQIQQEILNASQSAQKTVKIR